MIASSSPDLLRPPPPISRRRPRPPIAKPTPPTTDSATSAAPNDADCEAWLPLLGPPDGGPQLALSVPLLQKAWQSNSLGLLLAWWP